MNVLKLGAISAILSVIVGIVMIIFSFLYIISLVLSIIFYYAFVFLGKKFNNKLLIAAAWIFIIFNILVITFSVLQFAQIDIGIFKFFIMGSPFGSQFFGRYGASEMIVVMLSLVFSLLLLILFGAGLIQLRKKVEMAKITGLLYIIGAATTILIVGAFILLVAQICAIILLWKAAEELEEERIENEIKKVR